MRKVLLLQMSLILFFGFSNLGWAENENKKNEKISVAEHEKSVVLSWTITDTSNISKIVVMQKRLNPDSQYSKVKNISADTKSLEIKQTPMYEMKYKLMLMSNDNKVIEEVETQIIKLKDKNIVEDQIEHKKLYIYLPDGYNENSDKKYSVIYCFDGQNLFLDGFGSPDSWKIGESMKKLKVEKKIDEEMIVVGIPSGVDRDEEYLPYILSPEEQIPDLKNNPKGKEFGEFVVKKIVPYVENKYRISTNRNDRAVMGSSLGGLITIYMINTYSDIFSMAAPMSPWFPKKMIEDLKTAKELNSKIWIDSGSMDLSDIIPKARELTDVLIAKGFKYGENIVFFEEKGAGHSELDWAGRVAFPIIFFKGKSVGKIIKTKVEAYRINSEEKENKYYIDTTVEYENGIKFSLYKNAKYEVVNPADGKISAQNEITFITKKDIDVVVKYNGGEIKTKIVYEEIK